MGGIGVTTYHALGFDQNGKVFHLQKEIYEDGEETEWYESDYSRS